jgi:hypothetical protein
VVSRIPRSAATIIPYDVESRVRVLQERQAATISAAAADHADQQLRTEEAEVADRHATPNGEKPLPESAARARGLLKRREPEPSGPDGQPIGVPSQAPGVTSIGSLTGPGRAVVEGRIRVVEIKPVERNSVLACEISDGTGALTALFYGRSHIPGIVCGARVRFKGTVGIKDGHPVMINPAYELIFPAV